MSRPMKRITGVVAVLMLLAGMWQLGSASWIYCKAYLAMYLIDIAWQETLLDKTAHKPWAWADTRPVAELSIPAIGLDVIVLSGDSGATLAFGPGLSNVGADLDGSGVKLISAHRDTHFRKLKDIRINDEIVVTTTRGRSYYTVSNLTIVDARSYVVDVADERYDLLLATCYPFTFTLAGGSERYLVEAVQVKHNNAQPG